LASTQKMVLKKSGSQLDLLIDIKLEAAGTEELLNAISEQSGFRFVYDRTMLDQPTTFDVEEQQISVYQLLEKISRQSKLRFRQVNNNIHVKVAEQDQTTDAA